jgi:hypothetical protein
MKNDIIIAVKNRDLQLLDFMDGTKFGKGIYRAITKCQAGFMCSSDREYNSPYEAFRSYKLKSLHSIAYVSDGGYALTLYARNGKKVWINSQILSELTVGDINQDLHNTALYNQFQYKAVNAKSWASKAYVMNETNQEIITE